MAHNLTRQKSPPTTAKNNSRPVYENVPRPNDIATPAHPPLSPEGNSLSKRPYVNYVIPSTNGLPNSSPTRNKSPIKRESSTEWYVGLPKEDTKDTNLQSKPEPTSNKPLGRGSTISVGEFSSSGDATGVPVLRRQKYSDSAFLEQTKLTADDLSPGRALLNAKLRLLATDSIDNSGGCEKCAELQSVVALWELGVSGLTRNYSKILSQLNKAREAMTKLEYQLKQKAEMKSSLQVSTRNMSVSGRPTKTYNARQSMYETGNALPIASMVDQMYPQDLQSSSSFSTSYSKSFKDLGQNLGQAIDLCQQLAAANFKTNQHSSSNRKRLVRQPSEPSSLGDVETSSDFRPTLQSIAEASLSGSFKKRPPFERTPSAPDSVMRAMLNQNDLTYQSEPSGKRNEDDSSSDCHTSPLRSDDDQPQTGMETEPPEPASVPLQKPFYSHMMELNATDELECEKSTELSGESSDKDLSSSSDSQLYHDSILSPASTFSNNDVKHVMSKIADLEEERLKLLGTIDDLQTDNTQVRLSFREILDDLENKDLQLTLAMQDLTIATGEIKRAADMRRKLQQMKEDRTGLLERLGNLEDESAAVKVSLVQLLQEKSATNKTLAQENSRLNQRMKQFAALKLRRGSNTGASNVAGDGDDTSVTSGFSVGADESTLQEAYMETDDVAKFVHKQGFLVKQGGKVKNWKRRLFVLNTDGLAYFKTEQPLQTVPLEKIEKVQICHGSRSQYPYMFEVHTRGRVFMLSAPSEDEMQSWVGMLQTMKQYNRAKTLNREATLREQENIRTAQKAGIHPEGDVLGTSDLIGEMVEGHFMDEEHEPLHQGDVRLGLEKGDDDDDDENVVPPGVIPNSMPSLPSPFDEHPPLVLDINMAHRQSIGRLTSL